MSMTCNDCHGTGHVAGPSAGMSFGRPCPMCDGTGSERRRECPHGKPIGHDCGLCDLGSGSPALGHDKPYTVERVVEYWKGRAKAAELRAATSDLEIGRLSAVQDQNERLRITLANTVMAMRLWGADEDGVPEDGPIGAAFDAANVVLKEGDPMTDMFLVQDEEVSDE